MQGNLSVVDGWHVILGLLSHHADVIQEIEGKQSLVDAGDAKQRTPHCTHAGTLLSLIRLYRYDEI